MLTGFILTNTEVLGEILKVDNARIIILLDRYRKSCSEFINWHIIDIANYKIENLSNWHYYVSIINYERVALGLDKIGTYNTPLFIIGGGDVIPMPEIKLSLSENICPADILYCFDEGCENDLIKLVEQKPNFAVGRLPITKVKCENDSENCEDDFFTIDYLSDYLEKSISMIRQTISSSGVVMTTSESWYDMSKEVISDIPVVSLSPAYVPIYSNMITCPLLDTTTQRMYDGYVHELRRADIWLFCLHGSDYERASSFFGDTTSSDEYPIALQTSILQKTHPIILNTMACFGARYLNYKVADSMLLSAFLNGTMLYYGAGLEGYYIPNQPAAAVILLKFYNINLHKGYPAAMALLKAKQDYYTMYHDKDGDDLAMFTILEFNLFGCPILSMTPQLDMSYKSNNTDFVSIQKSKLSYTPKKVTQIFNKIWKGRNLIFNINNSDNSDLIKAFNKVESELCKYFHANNAELEKVYQLSYENTEIGYRLIYKYSKIPLKYTYIFECDKNGNILNVMGTF